MVHVKLRSRHIARQMTLRMLLVGAFLAIGVCLTASAWEEPESEIELYSTLKTDFVTPHTPWANPNAQGRLHGYYFVYSRLEGMETHAREAVELMQRLDLKLDVSYLYTFYREHWFGGDGGKRRIARLMRKPYDVYLFQDVAPSKLPAGPPHDGCTPFLERVRAGAGVVLIGTDDTALFVDARPIDELPPFIAAAGAKKAMTFGEGRIVVMPPRPLIPYRLGWEVQYDYWQEKLTRAVLWAAKREPAVHLKISAETAIERLDLPAEVVISWKGATPGATRVSLRLRRWDDLQIPLGSVSCDRAEGQARFEIPRGRAGSYHLDAFARRADGAVEGWATKEMEVTSAVGIENIELAGRRVRAPGKRQGRWEEELQRRGVDTPFVEVGETITGSVKLSGDFQKHRLRVSLVDRRGRELLRKETPARAEQKFSFQAKPWMPALLRVEARLLEGKEEVAFAYAFQRITRRRQGKFNFVLWDAPGDETLGPYAFEKLAGMGVTTILHHTVAPLIASAYDMSYVPWTGGNVHARDAEQWPDENYGKGFAQRVGLSRGAGVLCYSLGDEGRVSGMGKGPKTDAAFRSYLEGVYGDIGTLNREWGSDFKTFDEVTVGAAKQQGGKTADGLENHAPAYDIYYFGGYNFVQMARKSREWIRKLYDERQARIGFEGSGHLANIPCDPELICRELDMWVPYTGITEEFIRSVAPRSFIRSAWIGYSKDAVNHTGWYWRQIIHGADSVWYWMWSAIGAWQGLQGPDLDPPAPVRAMLRDTQIVRDGLGDLLLHYQMQHDGIAVLYSYPSVFVHHRSNRNKSYPSHYAALLAWQNVIHDLNMQYEFVTERILTSDAFAARGYKVLVLPQVWSISSEAVAAIRRFAENGGTIIADIRPALYDGRCRQLPTAAMDDLFGVRGGFEPARPSEMKIAGELNLSKLELSRPGPGHDRPVLIDPSVTLTTGQALGSAGRVPACVVNTVGKGRAVLLNFVPHSSFLVRGDTRGLAGTAPLNEMPRDAAYFFLGLFNAFGVERSFNFTRYKMEKVPFFPNVKVQRWKNGDYQIVAFFRQTDTAMRRGAFIADSERWPVSPQRKASGRPYDPFPWVYDIKNGVTVGQANWFIVQIDPGSPSLYALLPGPLPPMAIDLPKQARRGSQVKLKLSVPGARGLHSIKLRAVMPDGKPAAFWDRSIMVGKEPAEVILPLAWNDTVGPWQITFTDLFSPGTARTLTLRVE